ncbi:ABC transporter ATP-binding protein [Paracoccus sediminis]|uniref:ABC transporter ATP-binding protein n=2 Tax=Paracoccus sediminis TaxID=1214787 RepID=A0A238USG1_9RHOB|nr:ABC transporter ATP-binding protein [Paracoccus sediminis]TBN52903.1 ABC transporter ATP-binding protein [Paracoccus sediminis]SNR24617.1 iron complex transport system ATP-binding protein [Paracoccus sediminis]
MVLRLSGLSVTRRNRPVLHGVSLSLNPGEFVGLIGPNGAGKSSLMETALGLIPCTGTSSLATMPPAQRARHAAYLPQSRDIAWPVSVEDLVALGRIPWPGGGRGGLDRIAIDAAIARMGLEPYRKRTAQRLSGGEQNRALIARALAQDTPLLIADEPIAGLDPAQQLACLRLFRELAAEGRTVLASIHDLGLAARFCSRLVLLAEGHVLADGSVDAVLRDDLLARAFGITVRRVDTPDGPAILPV